MTTAWAWAPLVATIVLLSLNPKHPAAYDLASMLFAIPAITICGVLTEPRRLRLFGFIGEISYAAYALQMFSFFLIATLTRTELINPARPLAGAVSLALFLAACWLIDRCYDKPLRATLSRRRRRRAEAGL